MRKAFVVTGGLAVSLVLSGCAAPSPSRGPDAGVRPDDTETRAVLATTAASASSSGGDSSALPDAVAAQPVAEPSQKWTFSATPFMWFAGLDVGMSVRGRSASATINFGDVWDNLDMAAMAHVEANKGKWSVFVEGVWVELTDEGHGPRGRSDLRVTVKELVAGGYGAYRIAETKFAGSADAKPEAARVLTVDAYGGARYTELKGEVNPQRFGSVRDDMSWWDPVVGLRSRMGLTPEFAVTLRGDVGGWSGKDDASWFFMAGLEWEFCPCASLGVGYAVLTERYRNGNDPGDFAIKEKLSGPLVSVTIYF